MTSNDLLFEALRARFGTITPEGLTAFHRRFVTTRPEDTSLEIRVPAHPEVAHVFRAEIPLVMSLRHDHVVLIHEHEEIQETPYYVVDAGPGVVDRLRGAGISPLEEALNLLHDIASALAYCHQQGVVHGSLNPHTIRFQTRRYVLDGFGAVVGRRLIPDWGRIAVENPTYYSPELCRGEPVDGRSDIYGLGAVAYLCLAGMPPHEGATVHELIIQKTTRTATLPAAVALVNRDLNQLIERMLAPKPAERPQTVAEVLAALRSIPAFE